MRDTNRDIDIIIPPEIGPANQAGTVIYLMDVAEEIIDILDKHGTTGAAVLLGMVDERRAREEPTNRNAYVFGRDLVAEQSDDFDKFAALVERVNPIWVQGAKGVS